MKALRAGMVKKQLEDMAYEDEQQPEETSNQMPPTSMACSQCYAPYDLEERTPYNLTCDHSACKQCLRECHKAKKPYVCTHDSVVVPLQVIKTLSKNIEVIRALRERLAQEEEKMKRMRQGEQVEPPSQEVSRSADETINKLKSGKQFIDVSIRDDSYQKPTQARRSLSPAGQSPSKKPSATNVTLQQQQQQEMDQDKMPEYNDQKRHSTNSQSPKNMMDATPQRIASNYFPGGGVDRPSTSQMQQPGGPWSRGQPPEGVYRPPMGPNRRSNNELQGGGGQETPHYQQKEMERQASSPQRLPSTQALQHQPSSGQLKAMAGLAFLQTPLKEIVEEHSGDLTNTSYMVGGKKKKKKKKKTTNGDMSYSYAAEDDMLDDGNKSHRSLNRAQGATEEELKVADEDRAQRKITYPELYGGYQEENPYFQGQNMQQPEVVDGAQYGGVQLRIPDTEPLNQKRSSSSLHGYTPQNERAGTQQSFHSQHLQNKHPSSSELLHLKSQSLALQQLEVNQIAPARKSFNMPSQNLQLQIEEPRLVHHVSEQAAPNTFTSPTNQKLQNPGAQYATPQQQTQQDQQRPGTSQIPFGGIAPRSFKNNLLDASNAGNNEEIKQGEQYMPVDVQQKMVTERTGLESNMGNQSILNRRYEESEPPSRAGTAGGAMQFYNNLSQNYLSKSLQPKPSEAVLSPENSPPLYQSNNPRLLTQRSMNSTGENFMQPFKVQGGVQGQAPLTPLPQPFPDQCANHPNETVKYYCRNAECMSGLCWVCILQHARHDFIGADENAALEVKSIVRQAQKMCKKQASHLKDVRNLTEQKLQHLNLKRDEEFGKLNQQFSQLRLMLDEREIFLRASFNVEIREIENRLNQDVQLIHAEHQEYVNIFKELKSIGERFSMSSEKGIVSNARYAWELSKKTNQYISTVWDREKGLYVIQESQLREQQQDFEFQVGDDAHRDLKIPKFKVDFDKEKQKLELVGEIMMPNQNHEFMKDDIFNLYGETNPLFRVPEYNQIQLEELLRLQQDLQPQTNTQMPKLTGYSEDQKRQMIPLLERELQTLLTQTEDIYPQRAPQQEPPQSHQQQLRAAYEQLSARIDQANQGINIPLQNPNDPAQDLGIHVTRDDQNQLTIKLVDKAKPPQYEMSLPIPDHLPQFQSQQPQYQQSTQYQDPQHNYYYTQGTDPLQNSLGKRSLQGSFPPVLEENEEATPLEVTAQDIMGTQRQTRAGPPPKQYQVQVIQTQTENRGIQTKCKKTSDTPIQCQAETRNVKIQTKKQHPPAVKDMRSLTTQTPPAPFMLAQEVQVDPVAVKTSNFEVQVEEPPREIIKEVVVYRELPKGVQSDALIQTSKSLRGGSMFPDLATQTTSIALNAQKQLDDALVQTASIHGAEIHVQTSSLIDNKPPATDFNTQTSQLGANGMQTQTTPKPPLDVVQTQTSALNLSRQNSKSVGAALPPLVKQSSKKKSDSAALATPLGDTDQFRLHTTPLKNIHWFRWNTNELYRLNADSKNWELRDDLTINQRFLFFANVVHLPNDQGCFLLGGTDNDNNYSKRTQFFVKYNLLLEKTPMLNKRAFFSSVFVKLENSLFVFGGSDTDTSDLAVCEKYSLIESVWRPIAPMKIARNGTAAVIFENYRLIFVFGGNNHKTQGSLLSIEKYAIDYDKWQVIDLQLKRAIHDMQVMQGTKDRVLIFGGHTDTDGPNKDVELLDLSTECYISKYGKALALPAASDGGKTYFPPMYDPITNKLHLIFGYCDEAPFMEEVDFGNFMDFFRLPRTLNTSVRQSAHGSQGGGGPDSLLRRSSVTVLDLSQTRDKDLLDNPPTEIPTPIATNDQSFSGISNTGQQKPRSKSNTNAVPSQGDKHQQPKKKPNGSQSTAQLKNEKKVPKLKL